MGTLIFVCPATGTKFLLASKSTEPPLENYQGRAQRFLVHVVTTTMRFRQSRFGWLVTRFRTTAHLLNLLRKRANRWKEAPTSPWHHFASQACKEACSAPPNN